MKWLNRDKEITGNIICLVRNSQVFQGNFKVFLYIYDFLTFCLFTISLGWSKKNEGFG